MKEIIKIQVDKEFDMTEVTIRVPDFQNFGQRLGELQRKSFEAMTADPPNLEEVLAKVNGMLEEKMKAMPEGPLKEMILKSMKETDDDTVDSEEEEDIKQEENPGEFRYDLHRLVVSLPEGMKWDTIAESKVDRFLADWSKTRPAVLNATANFYKEQYAEIMEFQGDERGVEFILPKPGAPEVVADLFRISTIYLRDDGAIGLSGACTWDEEHGCGVLLKNGNVIAVGHISDAHEPFD